MKSNLFEDIPESIPEELFEEIVSAENVLIERIISDGHKSDEGFWYDQQRNEFVVLLQGFAEIEFENKELVKLAPGGYLNIPAHRKHRVKSTSEVEKTVWLAIHY